MSGTKRRRSALPVEKETQLLPAIDFSGLQLFSTEVASEDVSSEAFAQFYVKQAAIGDKDNVLFVVSYDNRVLLSKEFLVESFNSHFRGSKNAKDQESLKILSDGSIGKTLSWSLVELPPRVLSRILSSNCAFASVDADGESQGLRKWLSISENSIVSTQQLQNEADQFMEAYDADLEAAEKAKEELAARLKADGFTLVTRKGKNRGELDDDSENKKKKKKSLVLKDFYRFQKTEQKLQALSTLREKFEEDKERIRQLKAKRKFKPY